MAKAELGDTDDQVEGTAATVAAASAAVAETATFPYPTDADDHCETPQEAYQHIVPFLQKLARGCRKTSQQSLRIYDPYYCDGAVKRNFASLGFPNVYNEKQDCYKVWTDESSSSLSSLPEFDVLVTNPPYSGNHIERLMEFLSSQQFGNRPWCLLLPNWVHKKDYYLHATTSSKGHGGSNNNNKRPPLQCQPFYLVPRKRYVYLPPKGFREAKKSDVHKKASPFVSMWYICEYSTTLQLFVPSSHVTYACTTFSTWLSHRGWNSGKDRRTDSTVLWPYWQHGI